MMKLNLETIIIFVYDINLLKQFYSQIFDLEILEEIESEWVLLNAGKAKIGLHRIGEAFLNQIDKKKKPESNTKLVFEAKEDIHQLRKQLINQQVKMKEIKTFANYPFWICDGEDPEGNIFQIIQKK